MFASIQLVENNQVSKVYFSGLPNITLISIHFGLIALKEIKMQSKDSNSEYLTYLNNLSGNK